MTITDLCIKHVKIEKRNINISEELKSLREDFNILIEINNVSWYEFKKKNQSEQEK
jgi:hypothetical protein